MKLRLSLFALLAVSFVASNVLAAPGDIPSPAEPESIMRNLEERDRVPSKQVPEIAVPAPSIQQTKEGGVKLVVLKNVEFEGNTVYSDAELASAASGFIGKKVSFNELATIANTVTRKYRDNGYILSKAVLSPQKIGGGTVRFNVIEGYISEVSLAGDAENIRLIQKYAQKISSKRPINKKDLERYMLLADDLPGVTARSIIRPSRNVPGSSELVINLVQDKFEGAASVDNYGTRYNGPIQLSGIAAFNSLFGIYDRTTLRAVVVPEGEELLFGDILHEEQLGSEGTKWRGRVGYTKTEAGAKVESLDIAGNAFVTDNSFVFPVLRTRKENFTPTVGFKTIDSESELLGILTSEDSVRSLYAGFDYELEDMFAGSNIFDFRVVRGLDVFGASDDGVGRSRANGEHEFTKAVAEYLRVQPVYGSVSLYGGVTGQISESALLASEEVSYGGRRYGRAYDPAEIIGDNGVAGFIEVRHGDIIPSNEIFKSTQLYAFYDVAGTWNKSLVFGEPKRQTLASTGIGTRFNIIKDVTGDVSVAFPMTRKVSANGRKHGDDPRFFFSLIKRF